MTHMQQQQQQCLRERPFALSTDRSSEDEDVASLDALPREPISHISLLQSLMTVLENKCGHTDVEMLALHFVIAYNVLNK